MRPVEGDEDAILMARFVESRDRRHFTTLFQRYGREVVNHSRRFVRSQARAEELAQDVFVRVYTTKSYEPTTRFKTWLFRVATNVCLNELRRPEHRRRMESMDHTEGDGMNPHSQLEAPGPTPEAATSGKQIAGRLATALDALPAKQRAAFLMARQDQMSHEEIAQALDTSVSAVKSLIHRALETLRKEATALTRGQTSAEVRP